MQHTCEIKITEEEEELFGLIKAYSDLLPTRIVPRVAGGWVRDKILGLSSNDIDITLDGMTGQEFARGFIKFSHPATSKIGIIKINPEKSKHLETAVIKIGNFWVDFASLRSEDYGATRIPSIKRGTPYDDAMRRDFTVNSLFYNLNTRKIEDYTEMGVSDIRMGVIRTPLNPLKTFADDPLRILRAFRFSVQLKFKMCSSIHNALMSSEMPSNLVRKVTRERIGIEIKKIISCSGGGRVLVDMLEYGLEGAIFRAKDYETCTPVAVIDCAEARIFVNIIDEHISQHGISVGSDIDVVNLYSVLIFYSNVKIKRDRKTYLNVRVVSESLKLENKFMKKIICVEEGLEMLLNLTKCDYDSIILLSRRSGELIYVIFLLLLCYLKLIGSERYAFYNNLFTGSREKYCKAFNTKGVINGHDIIKLGISGPSVRKLLDESFVIHVMHPEYTKEDIIRLTMEKINRNM